eukprot:CAMPEP_0180031470 /NCGR_PEP_ID=MMETSP0984-20121128/27933_1 /TAXON_ID=483367 /ORGANISM="non described non described, Strain CCMP 2436" /LENGTH=496 /DNA_ID=CAMNT_0021956625 /DNA_START=41 /DNA_END=1529 /DNA_ORIENTATION=+
MKYRDAGGDQGSKAERHSWLNGSGWPRGAASVTGAGRCSPTQSLANVSLRPRSFSFPTSKSCCGAEMERAGLTNPARAAAVELSAGPRAAAPVRSSSRRLRKICARSGSGAAEPAAKPIAESTAKSTAESTADLAAQRARVGEEFERNRVHFAGDANRVDEVGRPGGQRHVYVEVRAQLRLDGTRVLGAEPTDGFCERVVHGRVGEDELRGAEAPDVLGTLFRRCADVPAHLEHAQQIAVGRVLQAELVRTLDGHLFRVGKVVTAGEDAHVGELRLAPERPRREERACAVRQLLQLLELEPVGVARAVKLVEHARALVHEDVRVLRAHAVHDAREAEVCKLYVRLEGRNYELYALALEPQLEGTRDLGRDVDRRVESIGSLLRARASALQVLCVRALVGARKCTLLLRWRLAREVGSIEDQHGLDVVRAEHSDHLHRVLGELVGLHAHPELARAGARAAVQPHIGVHRHALAPELRYVDPAFGPVDEREQARDAHV